MHGRRPEIRSGTYRWCIDAATPRWTPGGPFLGYVGSIVDITDRKRIEEAYFTRGGQLQVGFTLKPYTLHNAATRSEAMSLIMHGTR